MSEVYDVILGGLDTEVNVTIADSTGVDPSVLLALRGEKGDTGEAGINGQDGRDGADGADGFSPSASVSKVGDTATITITDKDGTTTASISDGGGGGASAFVAEYNVTPYADVKDAYDNDSVIICILTDFGNTAVFQLAYVDAGDDIFYFAQPQSDGWRWASVTSDDTWDDGGVLFASTDTATALRDGLMSALDYQKLSAIESGAEVNVQSDWSQSDNTKDDFIKNKPTIPSKSGLIDMFYPVGSFYETSDGSFDPNVSWGGTWILEGAGVVHLSAGTGYTIGSSGGSKDAIIPYHNHTASGGAVTDKASFNTDSSGSCSIASSGGHSHTVTSYYRSTASYGTGTAARPYTSSGSSSSTDWASIASNTGTHTHTVPDHTHSLPQHGHGFTQPTISYAGTDGNVTDANLPPYIVVNRWHRTA